MTDKKWQSYHTEPNDLYKVVDSVYSYLILSYLIQLSSDCQSVHPSQETLRLGLMSKPIVTKSIKELEVKGFVKVLAHPYPQANEYKIFPDIINLAIRKHLSNGELSKLADREFSDNQKDAMSMRRVMSKPELQDEVVNLVEFNKKNKTDRFKDGEKNG